MSAAAVAQVTSFREVVPFPRWQSRDLLGLNRVRFQLQRRARKEVDSVVQCVRSINAIVYAELGFYARVLECVDEFGRTKVALRIGLRSGDDRPLSEKQLIGTLGDRIFDLCKLSYERETCAYSADVLVLLDWTA